MLLKESELKKHISSGEFDNLYIIFGNEKMVVKAMTKKLIDKITGGDINDFNYHEFNDESELSDISNAVNIVPFMSPFNVVVIKDMDFSSYDSDELDIFLKMIGDIPDSTKLIFTMPTSEKEDSSEFKKVKNYIQKNGVAADISFRTELGLEKVLCKWAKAGGSKMSELTANKLIKYAGYDLNTLHSEVEKLVAYSNGEEITPDMISLLVNENLEAKVFDLFGYVVSQDSDRAVKTLDVLFYQQQEAVAICIILGNSYVDAYRARIAYESGIPMSEVAEYFKYKNRAWVLDKTLKQVRKITTNALRDSIDAIIDTQLKLVNVSVNRNIELEKLLSKLIILAGRKDD